MKPIRFTVITVLLSFPIIFCSCQTAQQISASKSDPVVYELSKLTTPSISDAIDQITGQRGFMSHEIRPVYPVKMAGRAVTVLAKPSTKKEPPAMALDLIDTQPPGKVLVIVMDGPDGKDVAAFGGIMATGSKMREFAGAVLDGGCRDIQEIEDLKFPVFTRGVVPSNSLGRYINVSKNEPVVCGGITVRPNDIVVGDSDGVVVVPSGRAMEILQRARELEAKEAITTKAVKKMKSIRNASQKHDRI